MPNFNHIVLAGTLVRDPEMRSTNSGTSITKFSLAVNREYKGKKDVTFFNVQLWGKTGEIANQYLKKGSHALISGRMECSKYTDKNGIEKYDWHVVGEQLQFLDKKEGGSRRQESHSQPDDDDSIPF